MTNSIPPVEPTAKVIVGVNTHKLVHVAVAINLLGARLATISVPADRAGYADLDQMVTAAAHVRGTAVAAPANTTDALRHLVQTASREGYTVRDIAGLAGVSHQYAAKLANG